MKKIINYLGLVLIALLAVSVGTSCAGNKLKQAVEEANKNCPQNLGNGVVMEKFLLEGNDVVCQYELDENLLPIKQMSGAQSILKNTMIEQIRNSGDKDIEEFITLLKENDGSFICRFKGNTSGESFEIDLPASEL